MVNFTIFWIILVFILLWAGNRFITVKLNEHLSWRRFGNIRFFTHLLVGILYSLLIINITYGLLKILLTEDPPTASQFIVMNVYGAIIFIPVFSLYFSLQFLRSWRKSELESEKFQKESMRSQLESLRSHLDPHFLFNSLNILSSLIEQDTQRSKVFLQKFAEVYRLILRSKSEDLISLQEEMDFIYSYCYLLETRFGDSIRFTLSIADGLKTRMIPPLTLQMLVENAIKHNVITERKPLTISIRSMGETIVVTNSRNEPPHPVDTKPGTGIQNIRMRYQYFTDEPVRVSKTQTEFVVTIPLLELS